MRAKKYQPAQTLTTWDIILSFIVIVACVGIPLEQMAYHADYHHPLLFGIRWVAYLFFSVDFIMRWRRGEYRGQPGWLITDLICALPAGPELMVLMPEAPAWMHVAAHSLPMLKILRVHIISRAWQQLNPSQAMYRRIASTILFIALMIHCLGCWQIAVYEPKGDPSIFLRYVQAIYWTVTTMTTVGYGDIIPDHTNASAMLFTIMIMLLGAGAFGFIIGNIATIMANLDFARNQHLDKLQRINAFMRYHDIPAGLRKRVESYFAYQWQTRRGFDESAVLAELPDMVRRDVEMELRKDIVSKVPIFRGADDRMIREVVAELKPRVAMPGEMLIQRGEIGDSMFFIATGSVEVLGPDATTPVATLNEGSFFGEIALLESVPRSADVRAAGFCDLYKLEKSALDRVVARYPALGAHIRSMADQRMKKA